MADVVRDIPEEMVEKAARALLRSWDDADEDTQAQACSAAEDALSAALAGRQVVVLPEPDESPERRGHIADWCPATWEIVAHLAYDGDPMVDDDDRMFTAGFAEQHGLALIAAARAARRYADERRSGSGED